MSGDHRKLVETFNVTAPRSDSKGVSITFAGRNSAGTCASFTVHLDWWAWPMLVKYVANHWIRERLRRLADISETDASFPNSGGKAA
jgi:hypothetical protein